MHFNYLFLFKFLRFRWSKFMWDFCPHFFKSRKIFGDLHCHTMKLILLSVYMSIRQVCRVKIVDGLLLNCSVTGSFVAQMCWFQIAFLFRTHLQRKPQILLNVSHKMYVKSAGTKVSPVVMLNSSSTKKIIKIQNSYMQYYIRDFV